MDVAEAFLSRDGTIATVVPAVVALLDPGLLKCVVDPSNWCMPPEVAHAFPPLDQCAGSGVTYVWTAIGFFIATESAWELSWSS